MIDIETKLRSMSLPNSSNYLQGEGVNKINIAKHLTPSMIDGFKFPRPPNIPSIRPQSSSSNCGCSSDSDTEREERPCKSRHRKRRTCSRNNIQQQDIPSSSPKLFSSALPPIGVFWDIENCNVPRGCSAVMVAQVIRTSFFEGYREAEFIVVCDVTKEHSKVIEELNDAQVSLIHVPSLHKNAADEKLRQAMRRFADTHGSPAAIVLITSDINFIADVSDIRHRHKIRVILLHRNETAQSLLICASEAYNIESVFESLPHREEKPVAAEPFQLMVWNLPCGMDVGRLRNRLRRVSDNTGGRVLHVGSKTATLTFTTKELAQRAQKRMQGADVFGNKIFVGAPIPVEKDSGRSETEDERLGSESPQVMARCDDGDMSRFAGAFGNVGANVFGDCDWSSAPRADDPTAYRNVQRQIARLPSRPVLPRRPHAPSISVTYTLPLLAGSQAHANLRWGGVMPTWSLPRGLGLFHRVIDENSFKRCLLVAMEYSGRNSAPQTSTSLNQLSKKFPVQNGHVEGTADPKWQPGEKIRFANGQKGPDQLRSIVKTRQDRDDLYVPTQVLVSNASRSRNANGQPRRPASSDGANGRPLSSSLASGSSEDDLDRYFHPISSGKSSGKSEPVELLVTNLEQTSSIPELSAMIHRTFSDHVTVLNVAILTRSDGGVAARVKVASLRDAQTAIVRFHRRKIGRKRLLISQPLQATGNLQLVKSRVISLLGSMPGHSLPLVTFFELFESRFCTSVSLADVNRLKDVCVIAEDETCTRTIRLRPGQSRVPSQMELGQCPEHGPLAGLGDGLDSDNGALPSVHVSLAKLTERIHGLVSSHGGSLPLASIVYCHEAVYGPVPVSEGGVPLEHLLGCIAGVEIYVGNAGKALRWAAEVQGTTVVNSPSPKLAELQTQLSREIVELLKKAPRCQLPFGKLIPAYHHHFSRQCRVADYGYTKLADLLDSMPHVVQVIGIGERREVTLSHRAQVRRFTADVLRMLKAQASRQVAVDDFKDVYLRATGRDFDVFEYGVCELSDLLDSLSESAVTVTHSELGSIISIPRRNQTPAEIANTKRFASEVVEMLWLAPQCRIPFTKFVPAYHHFFRRQCRVADMGFNKLIELLEAVGHVAQVTEDGSGERYVSLHADLSLAALSEQLCTLLSAAPFGCLLVADVPAAFKQRYGFSLNPEGHGCTSLMQLMHKLRDTIMVSDSGFGGPMARALDRVHLRLMSLKAWSVLVEHGPEIPMAAPHFLQAYWRRHREVANLETLAMNLSTRIKVYATSGTQEIRLAPTMAFAAEAYRAIVLAGGSMPWVDIERMFRARHGDLDVADLASAISDVIAVGADGRATLQPALAEIGIQLALGKGLEKPDGAKTAFSGKTLLGGFPLHREAPVKDSSPVKCAPKTVASNWDMVPKPSFPSYLEPSKDYEGLPISLPTLALSTDIQRSIQELTSPAKSLMSTHMNMWADNIPPAFMGYEAPLASKLPMPTALKSHLNTTPPSASVQNGDSGCGADLDSSAGSAHGSAGKHKRRLAAQFPVSLD